MTLGSERRTLKVLAAALVFVLGAQSIRFLFASITWYLRDTLHIGTIDLIPIALAPFILGAVFPIASRLLGARGALWSAVWMLALARTFNQIAADPAIDFWMAAAGTMAFVGALPLLLGFGREALVGGVLLGLAIDSAIKGMSLSLDLAYQSGLVAVLAVAVTSLAAIYVVTLAGPVERLGPGWGDGALLLGIGPLLMVQYLVLQNQGWVGEVVGMQAHQVPLRIALLNVFALLVVLRFGTVRWLVWPSVVVVVSAVLLAEGDAGAFNTLSLLAIPAAAIVWARMVADPDRDGMAASGFYLVTGMTLFVVLGLTYYLPIDLRLPFDSADVRVVVGVLVGLFGAFAALRSDDEQPAVDSSSWILAAGAAVLPLIALISGSVGDTAAPEDSSTVRVMSYNVHSAFNTEGVMDVEAIARVIEDSGATVVGFQEMPRGRLLSANTDLITLLQHRLGFEHVAFFGTTDPTWGNAVLSRFPIEDVNTEYLPRVDTPMQRGYLGAMLRIDDSRVLFISTHLQHVNDSDVHDEDPEADLYPVHHEQIATILDSWGGYEPAVLVGDFNARPGWQQIDEILDAGWIDSWVEAGTGDGFTANAADPRYRIDYVFHTPDLVAADVGVIPSQASDHFPVVADLRLGAS